MTIIERLLAYRERKMIQGRKPEKILLKWKHQLAIDKWLDSCDLNRDCLMTIIGYRILGMKIINKGE